MANRSLDLTDQVYDYLLEVSLREHPVLARLREETAELPLSIMQIAPEQGQFMRLLVQILGAKRCLEIGTFTGYSSLSVALRLPADGQIIACDVSVDFTEIALRYWAEAGVADKIDLRLGPAIETLDDLLKEGASGSFDFAFIDADKENYLPYYERCLKLIRPGGLIAVDNVLWNGSVVDPEKTDADTLAIRELNQKLRDDERVDISMVPIGDGLTLARKR
jgi:predicted O-methyltransferase YrrM